MKKKLVQISMLLLILLSIVGCSTSDPDSDGWEFFPRESPRDSPIPTPPKTLSGLIAVLSSSDEDARIGAIRQLQSLGPQAAPAIPALIQNLQYNNSEITVDAAQALSNMGPTAHPALSALVDIVMNQQRLPQERISAAEAVASIGDSSVIPTLATILYDTDQFVASSAARSIGLLAHQEFPDVHEHSESLDNQGVPLILTVAKKWWEQSGRHQEWPEQGLHQGRHH